MHFVDVSDYFWGFCRAVTTMSIDECKESSEFNGMSAAVASGLRLAIRASHPLMKTPIHNRLPTGCTWNDRESLYLFDGINELFYGAMELLDSSHSDASDASDVLKKCIDRISMHIDIEEMADSFAGLG